MTIAAGINRVIAMKKQAGLGTPATGSGGKQLSRTSATMNLVKDTYQSEVVVSHAQVEDFRHGTRSATGTLNDELAPGAHADIWSSVLRNDWAAGFANITKTTISAAAPHTIASTTADFATVKAGDVIRCAGFTGAGAANNRNFTVVTVAVDNKTLTVAETVVTKTAGDSVTISHPGKKIWIPKTGQTRDYYSIEDWQVDVGVSTLFTDVRFGQAALTMPASGIGTGQFGWVGRQASIGNSQALTTPTAPPATGKSTGVGGALVVGGAALGLLTGLNVTINPNVAALEAVMGSDLVPDIGAGRISVTGNFTAYFEDETLIEYFYDETEVAIQATLQSATSGAGDFLSVYMPRVKLGSAEGDDNQQGRIYTFGFQALLGATTTIQIQDSAVS